MPFLIASLLAACAEEPDTQTVLFRPYKIPCFTLTENFCLVGVEESGGEAHFIGGLQEFEFEWGVEQRVTFTAEPVEGFGDDGPTWAYDVIEVERVREVSPGERVEMRFEGGATWFTSTGEPDSLLFFGDKLACDPTLCADLLADTTRKTLEVSYEAPAGHDATIVGIVP